MPDLRTSQTSADIQRDPSFQQKQQKSSAETWEWITDTKKCPHGSLAQMNHDILEMKQKGLCWQYTFKSVSFANCFYLSIE